jgi:hypothetical protein
MIKRTKKKSRETGPFKIKKPEEIITTGEGRKKISSSKKEAPKTPQKPKELIKISKYSTTPAIITNSITL